MRLIHFPDEAEPRQQVNLSIARPRAPRRAPTVLGLLLTLPVVVCLLALFLAGLALVILAGLWLVQFVLTGRIVP